MKQIICSCGSTDFFITETLVWNAFSDESEDGLAAKNSTSEIDSICCRKCGEELENIDEISINFD